MTKTLDITLKLSKEHLDDLIARLATVRFYLLERIEWDSKEIHFYRLYNICSLEQRFVKASYRITAKKELKLKINILEQLSLRYTFIKTPPLAGRSAEQELLFMQIDRHLHPSLFAGDKTVN